MRDSLKLISVLEAGNQWEVQKRSDLDAITDSTGLADQCQWEALIQLVDDYIEENNVLDIQLVCLYFQAYFNLHHAGEPLETILTTLKQILCDDTDLLTPSNKREVIIVKAIQGLYTNLTSSLDYYKTDIEFDLQEPILSNLQEIIEYIQQADIADDSKHAFKKIQDEFIKVIKKHTLAADKNDVVDEKTEATQEEAAEQEKTNSTQAASQMGSFYWQHLLAKVSRFSQSKGSANVFEQALLFDSIQEELNNFNPLKYFPKEFYPFLDTLDAQTYAEVQQVIESNKGSSLWEFMLQKTNANIQIDPKSKQSPFVNDNLEAALNNNVSAMAMPSQHNQMPPQLPEHNNPYAVPEQDQFGGQMPGQQPPEQAMQYPEHNSEHDFDDVFSDAGI